MIIFGPLARGKGINGLSARIRLIAAFIFAITVCALPRWEPVLAGTALAFMTWPWSGLPPARTARRLAHINGLLLMIVLFLPWSYPGEPLWAPGPLTYSREGLYRALLIAVKANAVMAATLAWVGSMEPVRLAHALQTLRLPQTFVIWMAFMVRYIEFIHEEYHRLRKAMRIRGYRARPTVHGLRSLAYLFGMLMVRSTDRAERIADAMKCRGFQGRFPQGIEPRLRVADGIALATVAVCSAALLYWGRA